MLFTRHCTELNNSCSLDDCLPFLFDYCLPHFSFILFQSCGSLPASLEFEPKSRSCARQPRLCVLWAGPDRPGHRHLQEGHWAPAPLPWRLLQLGQCLEGERQCKEHFFLFKITVNAFLIDTRCHQLVKLLSRLLKWMLTSLKRKNNSGNLHLEPFKSDCIMTFHKQCFYNKYYSINNAPFFKGGRSRRMLQHSPSTLSHSRRLTQQPGKHQAGAGQYRGSCASLSEGSWGTVEGERERWVVQLGNV